MKKILFMLMMLFSIITVNAQVAIEEPKAFDNIYAGITGGATTPMNFNSVFPLNSLAGVKIGKELTPIFGIEGEGQAFFNDNNVGRWTSTFVKGTVVGLNGTVNLSNLIAGYQGTPRFFEVKTNTGLAWLHYWDVKANDLLAKAGIDFAFNVGTRKQHTFTVTPAVYWNLTGGDKKIAFNKNLAQIGLFASYTYHFKTSNGTHHFKSYDVGAMISEIDRLNEELAKKPKEVEVIKYVDRVVNNTYNAPVTNGVQINALTPAYVFFAQNSAVLTNEAKEILDAVPAGITYDIYGYASPEGPKNFNDKLSEARAKAVAEYLNKRNINTNEVKGCGVAFGEATGRVAIVKAK